MTLDEWDRFERETRAALRSAWQQGGRERDRLVARLGPLACQPGEDTADHIRRVAGHEVMIGASVYDIAALLEVDHELVARALGFERLYQRAVDVRDRVGFEGSVIEFIDRALVFVERHAEATP